MAGCESSTAMESRKQRASLAWSGSAGGYESRAKDGGHRVQGLGAWWEWRCMPVCAGQDQGAPCERRQQISREAVRAHGPCELSQTTPEAPQSLAPNFKHAHRAI